MDIGKAIEFAEKYLRDYVMTLLSVLSGRFSKTNGPGTAEYELTIENNRTWTFALISIILGQVAFLPITQGDGGGRGLQWFQIVLSFWMWLLMAAFSHALVRLSGQQRPFTGTLAACLRVMPAIYFVCCLSALTLFLLLEGTTSTWDTGFLTAIAFLFLQFVLLAIYLPQAVSRGLEPSFLRQTALTILLPTLVLAVNLAVMRMSIGPLLSLPATALFGMGSRSIEIADPFHVTFLTSRGTHIYYFSGFWNEETDPDAAMGPEISISYRPVRESGRYLFLADDRHGTLLRLPLRGGQVAQLTAGAWSPVFNAERENRAPRLGAAVCPD